MLFRAYTIYKSLEGAFPKSEGKNLFAVCSLIASSTVSTRKLPFGVVCTLPRVKSFALPNGESVTIPERIYFREAAEEGLASLTAEQKAIYHCIFSRSHDGYARERSLKALFALGVPDFALPYIVESAGDYVLEIVQTLYRLLCGENLERYREFCGRNIKNVQSCHSRMMSYWWEYYRDICPDYGSYAGKALFEECFGFYKTGQKEIRL
ncbi:MAG: hypothetical protein IJX27_08105 [Clostridia bacterium]|nr:hypothetical protein [Clostridia bacterium]